MTRGHRALRTFGGLRGFNFTLILVVSNICGMPYRGFFQGTTNAKRFNTWLQSLVRQLVLVWRNVCFQQRSVPSSFCANRPTRQPRCKLSNAMENCFSAWTAAFKSQVVEVCPRLQGQVAGHWHANADANGRLEFGSVVTEEKCVAMIQLLVIHDQ